METYSNLNRTYFSSDTQGNSDLLRGNKQHQISEDQGSTWAHTFASQLVNTQLSWESWSWSWYGRGRRRRRSSAKLWWWNGWWVNVLRTMETVFWQVSLVYLLKNDDDDTKWAHHLCSQNSIPSSHCTDKITSSFRPPKNYDIIVICDIPESA